MQRMLKDIVIKVNIFALVVIYPVLCDLVGETHHLFATSGGEILPLFS